jgi:Carboxypeptidase regulatory-like domain
MKISILLIARLFLITLCASIAVGQTNRGGITGTVFDKTGAVIPGATVIVTNIGTNESLRLSTSESGNFSAPSLNPVEYRITVEAAGFKKTTVDRVKVDTAVTATINFTLEPGDAFAEITVTSESPLINAASGTPGQTITERQIVEMPLNNRSVLDLVMTVANVSGVAGTEDPQLGSDIPTPGYNVSINGGRPGSTSILADGANNTGVGLARAVVTFSPDTVQEFTVQTSNFSAEFGQTGGGVVNMTTKSGTNKYNGLFYWYHRNPALNAAPFTTNVNNRPEANRRQHQFGLTLGGPVQLPKKIFGPLGYDGHDRTFFFVAVEPRYYYDGTPFTSLLPTEAMSRGDFTNAVRVNDGVAPRDVVERFGIANQIADATLYRQFDLVNGQFQRIQLPNGATYPRFTDAQGNPVNIIPANYLDPTSQRLLQHLPKPGEYFLSDGNLRNYASESFIKNLERRTTVRIDHQISADNRLTGRYTQVPIRGDRGRADFQIGRDETNSGGTDYSWSKQILLTDTHTFSPTLVNEVRLNYTYGRFTRNLPPMFDATSGRNFATELGLPSVTVGALPAFDTGGGNIGFSQSQQNENTEHSYGIANNLSWVQGNRTWKFGTDLMQQRLKTIPMFGASGGRYEFSRNRTLTNSNGDGASGAGGIEYAQFLMGTYNLATLREVLIPYYYQWNSAAFYVQNDWKVRPNFTLNLGMRYSLQMPRTEKYDRQGAFRPDLAQTLTLTPEQRRATAIGLGLLPANAPANAPIPDGVPTTTEIVPFAYVGRGGRSRYIFPFEKNGFEPRFGFAWTPRIFGLNDSGRLVLRGGYGLSHAPLTGMGRNPSPDFATGNTEFGTFDNRNRTSQLVGTTNIIPARICCNPPVISPQAPDQFLDIPADGLIYLNAINIAAPAVSENAHVPYVQSWSTTLAYEISKNTVIEVAYNGSKGTHLFLPPININTPSPEGVEDMLARGFLPTDDIADPLGRLNPTGTAVRTIDRALLTTKYMGYRLLDEAFNASANSIRHAGTVSFQRRHAKGLSFTANYTYGKGLDEASDAGDVRFVNLNVRSLGHVYFGAPRSVDRSVSLFDIKHAFSASFLYDLPFGRNRSLWNRAPGAVNKIIGDWSLSGISRIQGGLPLTTVIRDDNSLFGAGTGTSPRTIRPDLVPGVPLINPRWDRSCPTGANCEPYFNPAAFMRPVKGTLGNAPRTIDGARGPTQRFFDFSVQKSFPIGRDGKRRLQFRVDFINAFNHPVFGTGRLEDAGEIFFAPAEGALNENDYNAWADFNRRPRSTAEMNAINAMIRSLSVNPNRATNPNATVILPRDFFHVPVPEGFFSMNANSFDVRTPEGLKLYRLRQSYTADRWGFLGASPRSGYAPRFIQIALKFYF